MKRKVTRAKLAKIIGVRNSERIINVVTGVGRSGKTFQTKKIIKKYAHMFPKDKILILDSRNEYTEYKEIQLNQVKTFRKPSRIIVNKHKISDVVKSIFDFSGGLLVVEKTQMIIPQHELNLILASLMFHRTRDFDVIIISNSIKSIETKIILYASIYRFHRGVGTSDDMLRIHSYAKVAQIAVNASCFPPNKRNLRKFGYYDAVNEKILGVNLSDLYLAVCYYMNPKIKSLTKQLSSYGKN